MTDEMIAAIICREMGWTWQEYQDTPYPFVLTILAMLKAESEAAHKKLKG